ncbi:unnamed protein product [Dibothriocephalus latus]|uniref:Uncharacterized protein n=1 Tax=Dibothriocephalus latus TaxID=60516 RepID=A0A3P7PIN5_DIBLA|nr:unnamed protein product [Dibothriocephalus latus]
MPDLAGLHDVTSPCVMIGGNGSGELHPVSSPATETEDRRSKVCFHVLTDGVEPSLPLPSLLLCLDGQCRARSSVALLFDASR